MITLLKSSTPSEHTLLRHSSIRRVLMVCCATLLPAVFTLSSCGESAEDRVEDVGGVTAAQILENPEAYVGKTITVSGEVGDVRGPRAFDMDANLNMQELLVIGRDPFPQVDGNRNVFTDDVATVTGTVHMLVTAEIEREIGWDLEPQIETEFEGKPILIAQNTSFKAGPGQQGMNTTQGANDTTAVADANNEVIDVLLIINAPDRNALVGRRVRITNANVQSVPGDRTFYIGSGENKRTLVVFNETRTPNTPTEGQIDVNQGQKVSVVGTIERVPSTEEAKSRFGNMMQQNEMKALQNEQVYIRADSVRITQR